MAKKSVKKASAPIQAPIVETPVIPQGPTVQERLAKLVGVIREMAIRIETLEKDLTAAKATVATTKQRKPQRPRTAAELEKLAFERDAWFKKMGYGKYKSVGPAKAEGTPVPATPATTEAPAPTPAKASLTDLLKDIA